VPYIPQEQRDVLDPFIRDLFLQIQLRPGVAGQCNYVVTQLLVALFVRSPSYASLNAAIGVLECAKLELYRRQVAPYEDTKIVENGDI